MKYILNKMTQNTILDGSDLAHNPQRDKTQDHKNILPK